MPDMYKASADQNRKNPSRRHLNILGAEQNFPALHAIGDDAADQREKENGNAGKKLIESQQECRVAEPVNQPALSYDLHPCAYAGSAGAKPHQSEITILKSFKDPANHSASIASLEAYHAAFFI